MTYTEEDKNNHKVPLDLALTPYNVDLSDGGYADFVPGYSPPDKPADLEEATVLSSLISRRPLYDPEKTNKAERIHYPVLDLDIPAELVPSGTPGHHHLYLKVEVQEHKYMALLRALSDCGIIEQGYSKASYIRGFSAIRPPWDPKEVKETGDNINGLPF